MPAAFGCGPVSGRVVVDGDVITGGGVTDGIGLAPTGSGILKHLFGELLDRITCEGTSDHG